MLDVLRGFAASSVLVYHVIEHFNWTEFPVSGLLAWFRLGWMGVDLFLVISGFVIGLSAFALLERLSYRDFLRVFAARRVRRICPLFYATCLIYVVMIVPEFTVHPDLWRHLLVHAAFIHNLFPDYAGSIDGPNWTVALEAQFYLACGLAAPLLLRCRWWQLLLGALLISWTWRAAMLQLIPFDGGAGTFHRFVATTELPGTLDEFAAGLLLARLLRSGSGATLLRWGRRYPALPLAGAALTVGLTCSLLWTTPSFWNSVTMVVAWRTLCAAAAAAVVFAACCLDAPWLVTVTTPFRYLGTISFGIYLWHLPVLLSIKRIGWVPPQQALWVTLAATCVLAAGSWTFFERRFLPAASALPQHPPGQFRVRSHQPDAQSTFVS